MKANYTRPELKTRAAECRKLADDAADPRDRAAFLAAAEAWDRLTRPARDTSADSLAPLAQSIADLKRDVIAAQPELPPSHGSAARQLIEETRAAPSPQEYGRKRWDGATVQIREPARTIDF